MQTPSLCEQSSFSHRRSKDHPAARAVRGEPRSRERAVDHAGTPRALPSDGAHPPLRGAQPSRLSTGQDRGFLHLYIGQEAVAVGCCSVMEKTDHVITATATWTRTRVGMNPNELMARCTARPAAAPKARRLHAFFRSVPQFLGGHGIVGGQVPLGLACLRVKHRGIAGACLTFMGDGAVNQGAVHETYNLAALWNCRSCSSLRTTDTPWHSQRRRPRGPGLSKRAELTACSGMSVTARTLRRSRKADRMLQLARQHRDPPCSRS